MCMEKVRGVSDIRSVSRCHAKPDDGPVPLMPSSHESPLPNAHRSVAVKGGVILFLQEHLSPLMMKYLWVVSTATGHATSTQGAGCHSLFS